MLHQIEVPAKINFWLEVVGKRADGYHELSSLMLPVDIRDRLIIERDRAGISLRCDQPGVPEDERNLAWRAARAYMARCGEPRGLRIRLEKGIPVAAGLGGGSADAAGVLLLLNRMAARPLSADVLAELAVGLGADVPFFLQARPALAGGIGEILRPVLGLPAYPLVLLKPPLAVSTAEVYSRIELTRGERRIRIRSLLAHPWEPRSLMQNDLESITLGMHPELGAIKEWLQDQGALGALMSGSGPTLFGVFASQERARLVAARAVQDHPQCWVRQTRAVVV